MCLTEYVFGYVGFSAQIDKAEVLVDMVRGNYEVLWWGLAMLTSGMNFMHLSTPTSFDCNWLFMYEQVYFCLIQVEFNKSKGSSDDSVVHALDVSSSP